MLYKFLLKKVAKSASLAVAEHILRKTTLVVELGFAGACVAKCSAEAYVRTMLQLGQFLGEGLAIGLQIVDGLAGIAQGVGVAVFVRPLLVARASLDPLNWTLSGRLPDSTRGEIEAVGLYLWATVKRRAPDDSFQFMARPMNQMNIPPKLLQDLALGIARAMKKGTAAPFVLPEVLEREAQINAEKIKKMNPVQFVALMKQEGLLSFKRDPESMTEKELTAPSAELLEYLHAIR